jgi:hypothetical protein
MFRKAPSLAWLLAALTCFLAGMAVVEGRHQTVVLPVLDPVGVVVTVEVAFSPTATPARTPPPPPDSTASFRPRSTASHGIADVIR